MLRVPEGEKSTVTRAPVMEAAAFRMLMGEMKGQLHSLDIGIDYLKRRFISHCDLT